MRTRAIATVAALLAVAMTSSAFSQASDDIALLANRDQTMASLMDKLGSCDKCDRDQAAFLLGEGRFTEAVIPLMKVLHDCPDETSRIVAALALCRMKEPRGTWAVKRAVTFDESGRVRTLCAWFYDQYVQPGSYAFVPAEHPVPPQYAAER
jgi:HEAT repeat protein